MHLLWTSVAEMVQGFSLVLAKLHLAELPKIHFFGKLVFHLATWFDFQVCCWCEGMVAAEANMLNLPFEDQSFDVVIEKGAMVGNSTSLLQSL